MIEEEFKWGDSIMDLAYHYNDVPAAERDRYLELLRDWLTDRTESAREALESFLRLNGINF